MLPQLFLKTKLLPPRIGRNVLPRPGLLARMRSYLDGPATIVCANAGCGKTTLVADFVPSCRHLLCGIKLIRPMRTSVFSSGIWSMGCSVSILISARRCWALLRRPKTFHRRPINSPMSSSLKSASRSNKRPFW